MPISPTPTPTSAQNQNPIPAPLLTSLFQAAIAAKSMSYSPYSNFRVGCAILASNSHHSETIICGANVENASFPVGICAERCAGGRAVTEGFLRFRAVAVAVDGERAASPCGMCRQFIREFSLPTLPIYMLDKEGVASMMTLEELLPMSFGPEDLKGVGVEKSEGEE